MMVSGITLYHERPPAVAIPPLVLHAPVHVSPVSTTTSPVLAYAATEWKQHPDRFDRILQDSYDMHGRAVRQRESSGSHIDKRI